MRYEVYLPSRVSREIAAQLSEFAETYELTKGSVVRLALKEFFANRTSQLSTRLGGSPSRKSGARSSPSHLAQKIFDAEQKCSAGELDEGAVTA